MHSVWTIRNPAPVCGARLVGNACEGARFSFATAASAGVRRTFRPPFIGNVPAGILKELVENPFRLQLRYLQVLIVVGEAAYLFVGVLLNFLTQALQKSRTLNVLIVAPLRRSNSTALTASCYPVRGRPECEEWLHSPGRMAAKQVFTVQAIRLKCPIVPW